MTKKVKVSFRELSNSVVAEVDVEYEDEQVDGLNVLDETSKLMDEALKKSTIKTLNKMRK